ncbi:50S ribosomal protein L33 [Paenibacillus mucilaginosus]|nr:50S ribosomal protein L33 [Paenibacillus mucilaginosus]
MQPHRARNCSTCLLVRGCPWGTVSVRVCTPPNEGEAAGPSSLPGGCSCAGPDAVLPPGRLEIKKYCPRLNRITLHRETR